MQIFSRARIATGLILIAAAAFRVAGCTPAKEPTPENAGGRFVPSDDEIAALLDERMAQNGVGMVVAVIDGGRESVISHGVSGAANQRPLDGNTVFQLGSLTKVITGLLLAEMVVRGEVTLDDSVNAFLPPEAVLTDMGRPITLRDLATHTSGLPSMPTNLDINGEPDPYEAYSVEELWSFLSAFVPERAPGTAYAYSNLGVSLLGRALALRMGSTYEALIKERVLDPLGMTSTSITLSPDQERRLAPGHDPYLHPVGTWEMATLQASGSLRSTGQDMLKLLALYLGTADGPHLTEAARLQMREGARVDGTFYPIGLGLRPDGTYRHAGGKEGYRSGMAFNTATGTGAVALANTRTYDSEPMAIALHVVTGEPLTPASAAPEAKPRVAMSLEELERFEGLYRAEDGTEWEVVVAGGLLRVRYPNKSIFELVPSGPLDFFYNAGNDDVTFGTDEEGVVVSMTVYGDGRPEGNGQIARRVSG
jgi:CubicO group peptidase (beta-lactamase class C family)